MLDLRCMLLPMCELKVTYVSLKSDLLSVKTINMYATLATTKKLFQIS